MAYQPKSYRKFVATAATATLVATAVTPAFAAANDFTDVTERLKPAVDYLVANEITNGYTPTQFGVELQIKRVDAAIMLAKALKLDIENAPDSGFTDVPARGKVYVDALKAAGIVNGKTTTSFGSDLEITRGEAAIMLANAYKLSGNKADVDFTDVSERYSAPVAALVANDITNGVSPTSFGTTQPIKRGDFAVFLYKVENIAPAEVSAVAATTSNGVTTVTANVANAQYDANATVEVFANGNTSVTPAASQSVKVVDGKVSANFSGLPAGNHVVKVTVGEGSAQGNFTVAAVTPAVQAVTALNATQVQVNFNSEVQTTDAQTAGNYTINGKPATSAKLSDDKKSVLLTFANAADVEVTDGVLVVEPITTVADETKSTAKYTQVFTYEDKTAPTISSVEAKTNGTSATSLTVKASEPIVSALAKINGSYVTVNFNGTDTATITGQALETGKTHTLELINTTDKSGNTAVSTTATFTVSVDTTAPTATLSAKSDKEILVTFNKSMNVASVQGALATANGPVKDETLATLASGTVTVVPNTNDTQFIIPVTSTLYANKEARTLSVVLTNAIQDKLGNAVSAGVQSVTLTKDNTKPVATGYKVVKNNNGEVTDIVVSFSEGLKANETPAAPTIVNANGVDVTNTLLGGLKADPVVAGDKEVTYSVTTSAKVSGKYAFTFPASLVADQAEVGNTSAAFNYTIDFGSNASTFDLPTPALPAKNPVAANNVITVDFGRAVKGGAIANSATDVSNYTLAGKPLPEGTTIVLNAAQTVATITLPADTIEKTDANAVFTVANVQSLNNETVNTFKGTISVTDNVKPVLNAASLTADNQLLVGFNETLATAPAANDFVVKINEKTVALTGSKAITVSTGTGSDAGKYLLNIDDLIISGTNATPASNGPDETAGTADDVLAAAATPSYIDVDNSGTFSATADIKITDGALPTDFKLSTSPAITGVTVTTLASGGTAADAAGNKLKNDVKVTAK